MADLHDKEFGAIQIRRNYRATQVKLTVAPNGKLQISLPTYAPLFLAKRLINSSRTSIRSLQSRRDHTALVDGMQIGKSHRLEVLSGDAFAVTRRDRTIAVTLPPNHDMNDRKYRDQIYDVAIAALRREAKSYLPKRLAHLAERHNFRYQKVRFSHASTRWGSCSSSGTISLNIALMRLDFELIDYVLLHELCHTQQMNHSQAFWRLVEACDPAYKEHRKALKKQEPNPI